MKYILLLSLIIFKVHGANLIIYPDTAQKDKATDYLMTNYKATVQPLFTAKEQKLFQLSSNTLSALKVEVADQKLQNLKSDLFFNSLVKKIEINNKLKNYQYQNEYESLQWAIKNTGKKIQVQLTDIEHTFIDATKNEDIQIGPAIENNKKVRIAIIDSGIDLNHPDLKNKIYRNEKECIAKAKYEECLKENEDDKVCHDNWANYDSDNNGYPLDCNGWNVAAPINEITKIQGNNDVQDLLGHGTHVSGIIAAENNKIGIKGVMENVEILPVKVSGSEEETAIDSTTDIFAKGILYALQTGAQVINLSVGWASNEDSLLVTEVIDLAHKNNVLIVVAAGNSAHSEITYPCSYHEVICVGAHMPDGKRAHFSNTGSSIDIQAPGFKVLSTWPLEIRPTRFVRRHGYEFKDGTSFAAPHIAGLLGRLLNDGNNPTEARIKLLKGARKKIDLNSLILNGNADYRKARVADATSFIYLYKKTPALINWNSSKKKLLIKLKNYHQEARNIKLTLKSRSLDIKIATPSRKINRWAINETKEFIFFLEADNDIDSDLKFDLIIQSDSENKSYPIQATAMTIIHDDFEREDTKIIDIKSSAPLGTMSFKAFKNIDAYAHNDFLVIDNSQENIKVALMKNIDNEYKTSRFIKTPFTDPYFSHLAKLDLDQDGLEDYVVIGFIKELDKEDSWKTKFLVFNHNFKPKNYQLAPSNEYDNILTMMSTGIYWTLQNNKRVPTWISTGYSPSEDLPPKSPWQNNIQNSWQKRIYYIDQERLHTINIDLKDNLEYTPLTFFSQSNTQRKDNVVTILFNEKKSFQKLYYTASLDNLSDKTSYNITPYQNISKLSPIFGENSTELFFTEIEKNNTQTRVTRIDYDKVKYYQESFTYKNTFDPVQMLINNSSTGSWALTKYNLLLFKDNETYVLESRNTDYQIQYKKLQNSFGLYLPSTHTPGYSSELISLNDEGKPYRSSKYRFLTYESCYEIDFIKSSWQKKDSVVFYCEKNKKILFIELK